MKKTLLSLVLLTSVMGTAQTVLLDEGFESYTNFAITGIGSWQTLDLDGLPTYTGGGPVIGGSTVPTWTANWPNRGAAMAFQIFNPSASNATNNLTPIPGVDEEVRNFTPHGGQKMAVSWAAVVTPTITANNDWLVSPPITLGAGGNQLSLWVKALSPDYVENYKIGVYIGSGTPTSAANFTIISGASPSVAPYAAWQQVTQSLDTYSGQTIRIGIQYMSDNRYMFMVDDVKVTTGTLSTSEVSSKTQTSIYPNPTKGEIEIKTDKKIKSVSIFDVSGRSVLKTTSAKPNLSSFSKGTYLMQVEFADGTSSTEKVIKE
ncbi:T9SS-dependent choice-of-anchor J family protein [Chryseobacterium paridis]|uniref:T9SS type A sorting domain-containing protein n=1 Tax=Chryseobacterium paridis TaxID=2800328 RepID=A0ABS1FQ81_9FLAO|nr:choice-of-anchor J domain-containing protein [Chryseobacterium paridis]MBK1894596.1 T9SS type A sorting domain-containing protein [Chryseobacterium paridis]